MRTIVINWVIFISLFSFFTTCKKSESWLEKNKWALLLLFQNKNPYTTTLDLDLSDSNGNPVQVAGVRMKDPEDSGVAPDPNDKTPKPSTESGAAENGKSEIVEIPPGGAKDFELTDADGKDIGTVRVIPRTGNEPDMNYIRSFSLTHPDKP